MVVDEQVPVSLEELVGLAATDQELFGRTFFPKTLSQDTPDFHLDMDALLDNPNYRFVGIEAFRGSAKTSKTRLMTAKRISYGISRTILFVGASQDHAKRSVKWLRRQIEVNSRWAQAFGLKPGGVWTDEWIDIEHVSLGIHIHVLAYGITGKIRGINLDDHRPDLIVGDDICDDENAGTPEQRHKISTLIFGALSKSLAPSSETPEAKMVLLQTSIHPEDVINQCHNDAQWKTLKLSCFTADGESVWPKRFPLTTGDPLRPGLREDKQAHIERNQLHLWLREMECSTSSQETALFRPEWLQHWHEIPAGMKIVLTVDPVPPASDAALAKGLEKRDKEAFAVIGALGPKRYLLEYSQNRGHTPGWTIAEFFRLLDKWRPLKAGAESVAYQATLKWLLEEEMKKRGRYVQLDAINDRRSKRVRITQALSGVASNKMFFIHPSHLDFATDFASYPDVKHDDLLDCVAMGLTLLEGIVFDALDDEDTIVDPELALPNAWRTAP